MGLQDAFYDDLAPYFREYARRRRAYLEAIDRLVGARLKGTSLLDVGSGDGVRASVLAARAGLEHLELVEPSPPMAALCRQVCLCVRPVSIQQLELPPGTFDNVTCLWNVLGHIRGFEARVAALQKMGSLLTAGGSLHLDVHNRYNLRAYGWRTVVRNLLHDLAHPGRENGEREFELIVSDRRLRGRGYLFNPREIRRTIRASGLRVLDRAVIDYQTGRPHGTALEGQLYFQLGLPEHEFPPRAAKSHGSVVGF
ncbi:MAG: class I SAM-dependent methyltransferase [Acidobacteriota bacterium]